MIVHELAHELLHRGENRPASKTVHETEAVAFVVSQVVGLNAGARDYIQLYDGNTKTLAASLDRIQKTAADIIAALHASEEQAHAA